MKLESLRAYCMMLEVLELFGAAMIGNGDDNAAGTALLSLVMYSLHL